MSKVELEQQFKNTLILFLDELIGQFPEEGDLVVFRIFLKDRIDIKTILKYFMNQIIPLKEMITNRNEIFFLNHCRLFENLGEKSDKVNKFKQLWQSDKLDDDDKIIMWKWFDLFIKIGLKYEDFSK
jgi:hypothetical protein